MTKYVFWLLVFPFLGRSFSGWAQQLHEFRYQNDVKITVGSKTTLNPWSGGLNSAVISKLDLNQDNTEDLFIFDRTQNKGFTYLARQVNGQWQWVYQPDYEALFPADLTDWVLLRDYNQDGKQDIFTKTNLGIKVYRNTTPAAGPLTFALAEDFIRFNNGINLQVSGDNLPAITDMDNDGDLDVLCFDFAAGHTMQLYHNRRVEDKLAPDSLRFRLQDAWWGKLTKCEDACGSFMFMPATFWRLVVRPNASASRARARAVRASKILRPIARHPVLAPIYYRGMTFFFSRNWNLVFSKYRIAGETGLGTYSRGDLMAIDRTLGSVQAD